MKPLVKPRQNSVVNVVQGDIVILAEEETALNNAEANCAASGTCSLPAPVPRVNIISILKFTTLRFRLFVRSAMSKRYLVPHF